MTSFNLNNIIAEYNLDVGELAKVLFPTASYPKLALARITKGEACLSVEQVERLATHIGVLPSNLFTLGTWKDITEDGYITFIKGPFKVKLNYNGVFLTLYKDDIVIDQKVACTQDMSIPDFMEYINDLITKYQ